MKSKWTLIGYVLWGLSVAVQGQDCTSGGCHAERGSKAVVHVPVEEGDCLACHEQTKRNHPGGRGREIGLVAEEVVDICTTCHDLDLEDEDLHPPVAEGSCLACHDPHESDLNSLLKGSRAADVCGECHETGLEGKEFIHGPVAVGACDVCHSGHGQVSNTLLRTDGVNSTCYQCHELKAEEIASLVNQHAPVEESCTNCHNAHESDTKYQLEADVPDLCLGCHSEIDDQISSATSHHQAVESGKTCLNCHLPHGSEYEKNLKAEPFDLCMQCHNKPLKIGKTQIPDMEKFLEQNPDWHGPIREKNCAGCHNPHGTKNIRLLKYSFPRKFYAAFDVENYQLCFQCHPSENVLDSSTTRLTNFRDGDRNLHYLHVNREKGRTCRACHQVHASTHSFHIRAAVPFGGWQLPINYEKNDDGGRCSPGCHKPQTYSRSSGP
ncbi:MAG: hypothetical protein D6762_09260 [Candidatus Neomarinimicrobiota bacterium]|nr:MAG: hypothetical protein D6762_09260 [Candidatus Neomarinimicrobiota bacterium]